MKLFRRPVSLICRGRSYAVHAIPRREERLTRIQNGMVVLGHETHSPVVTMAVVYNSGARHESDADIGLTHCLRMAVTQSGRKATPFGIARNLQQIGSTLMCTTSREQTIYSVQCMRDYVAPAISFLGEIAAAGPFKHWELEDAEERLKFDLDVYASSPNARLLDAVHKAAFRGTLSRSLYMNPDRIGSYSTKALDAFVSKHYVTENAALIGIGIDQFQLSGLTRRMILRTNTVTSDSGRKTKAPPPPDSTNVPSKFHAGGEVRVETSSPLVHAALVTEGVNLTSSALPAIYVLQQALGGTSFVQRGSNSSSKILKAASAVTGQPFTAQCFSASYTETGLFGIQAAASHFDIGKVLRAIVTTLKEIGSKGAFTDGDVQSAKARVKMLLEMSAEDPLALVESFSTQIFQEDVLPLTSRDFAAVVDSVTTEDVNQVAKQLLSGKMSMAAVGNLIQTPYLDELV